MATLTNEDLEAVPAEKRRWTTWNYAALWIGMAICIPTYQLASGLIAGGMNWWQAILTVALGNLIVLVPMILNGHAGAKYGIPFPVFARASFGTRGANVPAILRAIVACGWFGIQTWIGGAALAVVVEKTVWPSIAETTFLDEAIGTAEKGPVAFKGKIKDASRVAKVTANGEAVTLSPDGSFEARVARDKDHKVTVLALAADGTQVEKISQKVSVGLLDVRVGDFLCFLGFWVVNMLIVWAGIDSIRKLLVVKSFFLPMATLGLLIWAYSAAGGFGEILRQPAQFKTTGDFFKYFFPALTGMVGFWATLSLNIPDFTRYATSQRAQTMGQALGLPTSMTAVAFVGVAVTSATMLLPKFGGQAQWDPKEVVRSFDSALVVAFAMFCVTLSTLATNIAANIVSPANDFANLSPARIGFRAGGFITGLIGIFMIPWKLIEDPSGYIFTWLIGYSALLGPIGGILIVDYFLVRKTQLDVTDLYRHEGRYGYSNGWNPAALLALAAGIAPCVPGFLVTIAVLEAEPGSALAGFAKLYDFAWFVGFGISGTVYFGLSRMLGVTEPVAAPEAKAAA